MWQIKWVDVVFIVREGLFFRARCDLLKADNPLLYPEILLILTAYLCPSETLTFVLSM